jgi:CxxC motif-containing protein (DUF1111 family)
VVRPFGWKGTHSTLRRFAEEAFQVHHGPQSATLLDLPRRFGTLPKGSSPATVALLRSLGDGSPRDPDRDRAEVELQGSTLTAIAVYLTLLPLPIIDPPRTPELLAAWRQGVVAFSEVGCASCHKPSWLLKNPVWTERGEDETSPYTLELDLRRDIHNGPPLKNWDISIAEYPVFVYSDLRRHDMGPELADPPLAESSAPPHLGDHKGPKIPPSYFLTRPLWGLADSGPYLHDGRAVTLHEAIIAHGGEAQAARDAYARLPPERQRALQVFLYSLCRQPLPEVSQ